MPRTLAKSLGHLWRLCASKPMAERVDMTGRSVVVTGASPGSLGYETARILAGWGARVVATSRRNAAATENGLKSEMRKLGVAESNVAVRPLDLCDAASVAAFASWYRRAHEGRLHVLVNNAGILRNVFAPRRERPRTGDGFDLHWRTNYLGAFHLTALLLPCLRQAGLESGDARVINVTSHLHDRVSNADLFDDHNGCSSWDAYALSKLALIHFSFELDRRFARDCGLRSVAVNPGSVKTNLTRTEAADGRLGSVLERMSAALASLVLLHRTHGAQTIVMCASRTPLQGGRYYERCRIAEPSGESRQEAVARRLWDQTDEWVGTLAKRGGE